MRYKELKIVLSNGIILNQNDIAKITGYITKTNKQIQFEINLNNNKDIYKLYRDFGKEIKENLLDIQKKVEQKTVF